jgi:hypothetical protein
MRPDGSFATNDQRFAADIAAVNAFMRPNQGSVHSMLGTIQAQAWYCLWVSPAALHAYVLYFKFLTWAYGSASAAFWKVSIAGIPLSVLTGALGIASDMTSNWYDWLFGYEGWYSYGVWICPLG